MEGLAEHTAQSWEHSEAGVASFYPPITCAIAVNVASLSASPSKHGGCGTVDVLRVSRSCAVFFLCHTRGGVTGRYSTFVMASSETDKFRDIEFSGGQT